MSFFITIKNKTIKVPNQIIVGRGAPFENLLESRDISRAHAKFFLKKDKLYIQDLKSHTGTFVNGKKLMAKKVFQIKEDDQIYLGEHELSLALNAPCEDYDIAAATYDKYSFKHTDKKIFFLYWIGCVLFMSFSFFFVRKSFTLFDFLGVMGVSLFITLCSMTGFKLGRRNAKHAGNAITEAYYNKNGITLHYAESNMSIPFTDIDKIIDRGRSFDIVAKQGTYFLSTHLITDYDKFKERMIRLNPNKVERISFNQKIKQVSLALLVIAVYFAFDEFSKTISLTFFSEVILTVCVFMLLACFVPYFNEDIRKKLFSRNKIHYKNSKKTLGSAIMGFLLLTLIQYEEYTHLSAQGPLFKKCEAGDIISCKKLDYTTLYIAEVKGYDIKKIAPRACSEGVKRACFYSNLRSPANKK